jgi:hypothetical protein
MNLSKGDAVTYGALVTGAVLQALEPWRKEAAVPPEIHPVLSSPVWAYVPLVLLTLVGLIWLAKQFIPTAVHAPPAASTPVAATPAVSFPAPQKVFIDISPAYLMDLYKDRTSIQGDALAAAYLGKWIVVTGKMRDVYIAGEATMVQMYDNDDRFVSARFSKEGSEKVSQFATGTIIKVRGEIYEIDSGRVRLQQCELDQAS